MVGQMPPSISYCCVPRIEIGAITGGFGGITAEIKNVGGWRQHPMLHGPSSLKGGMVLLGRETTGTFTKILPGFTPKAKTGFVFGFGSVDILVTAGDVKKTATALLLGPFILKVQ